LYLFSGARFDFRVAELEAAAVITATAGIYEQSVPLDQIDG